MALVRQEELILPEKRLENLLVKRGKFERLGDQFTRVAIGGMIVSLIGGLLVRRLVEGFLGLVVSVGFGVATAHLQAKVAEIDHCIDTEVTYRPWTEES